MSGSGLAVLSGGRWDGGSGAGQRLRLLSGRPWGRVSGARVVSRSAQSRSSGGGGGWEILERLGTPVRSGGGRRDERLSGGRLRAPGRARGAAEDWGLACRRGAGL